MEKSKGTAGPTIILRQRNAPYSRRNSQQILHEYYQDEVEYTYEKECYKFRKGIVEWCTNYESYQRVFEGMPDATRKGRDQIYLFGGDDEERLDTFLGNSTDPGFLPIFMIYLLQEKYRSQHECMSLRIAFVEHRGGQFYDLLAPKHLALRTVSRQNYRQLEGHAWVKLAEYIEFLRLLKIALFNNKTRDFRVSRNEAKQSSESIFMVKVHVQVMAEVGQTPVESTIYLIDIQEDYKKEKSNVKTQWDHLCQCLKSLRKEGEPKAEKNTFSHYLEPAFRQSIVKLVYCLSSVKDKFPANLLRLHQLKDIYQTKRLEAGPLRIATTSQCVTLDKLKDRAVKLIGSLDELQYSSFRHLNCMEQTIYHCIETILQRVDQSGRLIGEIILTKAQLELEIGGSITELVQLVGSSVKTEHIKEFYDSKTYASLYREVDILTEARSNTISSLTKQLFQLIGQYQKSRNKQSTFFKELIEEASADDTTLKTVGKVLSIAKGVLCLLNNFEASLYTIQHGMWLEMVMSKAKLQQEVKCYCQMFRQLQSAMKKLASGNCRFKQQRITANNNIISKTVLRLQQDKQNSSQQEQLNESKRTTFPRLMFQKLKSEQKPNKRFTIKLSDFLFRINREPAAIVLKEQPLPRNSA